MDRDSGREELHLRRIEMRGFRRRDGLFEVEGRVVDTKPVPFTPISNDRAVPPGEPIHHLGVRLVFDVAMEVKAVQTFMDARPYAECAGGGDALQALVGLRMTSGWAKEVNARLRGACSCAHLRELLIPMASAAFQAMTLERFKRPEPVDEQGRPRKIDSCWAYGAGRGLVKRRWPQFHRAEDAG